MSRDRGELEDPVQLALAIAQLRVGALDSAELTLTKAELIELLRHKAQLLREHGAGIGGPHRLETVEEIVLPRLHGRDLPFQLFEHVHEVAQLATSIVAGLEQLGDVSRTD
jgi:hypothetical protein